jgi:hypothetical protein
MGYDSPPRIAPERWMPIDDAVENHRAASQPGSPEANDRPLNDLNVVVADPETIRPLPIAGSPVSQGRRDRSRF